MENTSNLMNSDPYITALKFSRDGNLLAVGDKTGKIHILNSENTEISEINAHSLPAHKNHVSSSVKNIEFLYTHNNRAKLFSSNEKTIKL